MDGPSYKSVENALEWIRNNIISGEGIAVSSKIRKIYPEVTGYLIPTLITWGERDLAKQFADHLVETQNPSGSYCDPDGKFEMVFDTGQIMRGLNSAIEIWGDTSYVVAAERIVNWVVTFLRPDGNLDEFPDFNQWRGAIPNGILLYAVQPIFEYLEKSGQDAQKDIFVPTVNRLIDEIDETGKGVLSHFNAYIIEELLDLGYEEKSRRMMAHVYRRIDEDGFHPGKSEFSWVCTPGQFQYSLISLKLGDIDKGLRDLNTAAKLQNRSGGWFGSYEIGIKQFYHRWFSNRNAIIGRAVPYFSNSEVPWANKYFLDAVSLYLKIEFENQHSNFPYSIDGSDGRLKLLRTLISETKPKRILDAGCGKGRYLRGIEDLDGEKFGFDISEKILGYVQNNFITKVGSLTNIPFEDESFDFIYAVESIEHCVSLRGAIGEIKRVLSNSGTLLVIDKLNLGPLNLLTRKPDWEQWFSNHQFITGMENFGFTKIKIYSNIEYEGMVNQIRFNGWVFRKSLV